MYNWKSFRSTLRSSEAASRFAINTYIKGGNTHMVYGPYLWLPITECE